MADDEFVIGFSDSEWTGIAPILEEDVAISSLAQDELGHAQALYELLAQLLDDGRDADAIAYDRAPDEYRHARLLDHGRGDWAMTIARRYLYDTADAARLEALATSSFGPLRELVDKIRREERYHVMHVDDVARAPRRPRAASRASGCSPRSTSWARTRRRCSRRSPARTASSRPGDPGRADGRDRGPLAGEHHADVRRPRPADAARGPARGRPDAPRRAVPLALERVHDGPPRRPGGDVVIETAAPSRAATAARRRPPSGRPSPRFADPEIPIVSIVDLGIVDASTVAGGRIAVELLPTFVGCPALEMIRGAVARAPRRLRPPGRGRLHLRASPGRPSGSRPPAGPASAAAGIAPPPSPADVRCPFCDSARVVDGQRVRPDAVPLALLLPRLPPAVRGFQADLRPLPGGGRLRARCWTRSERRRRPVRDAPDLGRRVTPLGNCMP